MHIRTKLILSYAAVIALCLVLAAAVSAALLRNYQSRFISERVAIIAETTAPILHDNNDPGRFDAATQVAQTAGETGTRMIVLSASMRDLTAAQQRARLLQPQRFQATVQQDTAGLLPPGTPVMVPRAVFEQWQQWQRTQAAQAPKAGTPAPLKNAQLNLPEPTTGRIPLREGEPLELAMVPLRAEKGAGGGEFRILVVAEPVNVQGRPLAAMLARLGWAAGIAFLISILVALVLTRSITGPLIALTRATRALARGDYSQRVPAKDGDEVGELGGSFNQLAQDLERIRRRERDFLANISHDLKTPLTSIQGFAGALVDGTCPPDAYPAVARIIHEEAQRMGQLVGDVLQLSRLEAGELPLALAPVDIAGLLREGARRFAAPAQAAGVALRVDAPAERALTLLGDRGRLDQVLGNLIENALRYTPAGGRIDLIAAPLELAGKPGVRLLVRDTGAGIAPQDLPRVFERFYQADKARVAGRAGSGLGLAIVKELIERHGGTVRAESTLGAGTTIVMTLPLARSETDGPSGTAPPAPPANEATDAALVAGRDPARRGG